MLKSMIALVIVILLSIVVILFMPQTQHVIEWVVSAHNWVADTLTQVFSGGEAGDLTRKLLALLIIPFAIGLIPVIIFWLVKRRMFPYFMHVVGIVWLIETVALAVKYSAGG